MNASLTLLNVGNTHAQIAVWNGDGIAGRRTVPTSELSLGALPESGPVAGATVVPDVAERLAGRGVFWLNCRIRTGLEIAVDPATFGGDRLANAIELAAAYPLPGMVIDCGTAITCEVVDAGRRLLGGAIAPGRQLMRQSLHRGTAQLPMTDFTARLPEPIGADTRSAIASGVDLGAIGLVRELIRQTRERFPGGLASLIVTGGDAAHFRAALPELRDGGDDFTLRGIRRAWELNRELLHAR